MKTLPLRNAIAMIELIFAIVIIAFALAAAPMLVSQAAKSAVVVAQQEAIAAVATNISTIMTHPWDEGDTNESVDNPILMTGGDIPFNEVNTTATLQSGRRIGTPPLSTRTFLTSVGTRIAASTQLQMENNDTNIPDDIDDYNGDATNLTVESNTETSEGNYMDRSILINTLVNYTDDSVIFNSNEATFPNLFDTVNANTTNIKLIISHITSGSNSETLETDITLRAFSCNIGTYGIGMRAF